MTSSREKERERERQKNRERNITNFTTEQQIYPIGFGLPSPFRLAGITDFLYLYCTQFNTHTHAHIEKRRMCVRERENMWDDGRPVCDHAKREGRERVKLLNISAQWFFLFSFSISQDLFYRCVFTNM